MNVFKEIREKGLMNVFKEISNYRKAYSNWFSVLYKIYKIRKKVEDRSIIEIKVTLRNTKETVETSRTVAGYYSHLNFINKNPKIHNLTINQNLLCFSYEDSHLKFDVRRGLGDLIEVFFKEVYNFLKVEGKTVIDIGANIGDTTIYFAVKGAEKVISLEPYPYTFAIAKKNIDLSEFKNKIELINAGYGEDKKIIIDTSFIPDSGSGIRENENGTEINLFSLKTLMSKYHIVSGILKMDCEGCEYNLLNEDNEILKKFAMIQIEYHYGYEKLVNKLTECGFDTKFTMPTKFYSPTASNKNMLVGYVFGTRTDIPKAPLPST